jgi:hypothetical protein
MCYVPGNNFNLAMVSLLAFRDIQVPHPIINQFVPTSLWYKIVFIKYLSPNPYGFITNATACGLEEPVLLRPSTAWEGEMGVLSLQP